MPHHPNAFGKYGNIGPTALVPGSFENGAKIFYTSPAMGHTKVLPKIVKTNNIQLHPQMQKKTNNTKKAIRVQDIKPAKNPNGGAGKVNFNPFSITRKIDKPSPNLGL